jgi:hypothetical protein
MPGLFSDMHRIPSRRRRFARPPALLVLASIACAAPPVDWAPPRALVRRGDASTLDADGAMRPDTLGALASHLSPPGPACAGSVRAAAAGRTLFAVWWAPRPDSSVRLVAARSTDGGRTWAGVAPVDTTDASTAGCRRAAADIAADSVSGYVHVTYALQAKEGPGLFFSHSMDGGNTFHEPVPILYGERLGRTSVAADGDLVVVAFEDPNSSIPSIGLALSRSMGHIFEHRILPVSDDNGIALHPMTAIRGRRVAVGWQTSASDVTTLVVRTGTVR